MFVNAGRLRYLAKDCLEEVPQRGELVHVDLGGHALRVLFQPDLFHGSLADSLVIIAFLVFARVQQRLQRRPDVVHDDGLGGRRRMNPVLLHELSSRAPRPPG
jgi:hypothetical protein